MYFDITRLCETTSNIDSSRNSGGRSSSSSSGGIDSSSEEEEEEKKYLEHTIGTPKDTQENVMYRRAARICRRLRQRLKEELGFECCGGISNSKMASKIAVNVHKPNGQTTILPDAVLPCLLHRPLRQLTGIGWKTSRSLAEAESTPIITVADALSTPLSTLERILSAGMSSKVMGVNAARKVFFLCRGIDNSLVIEKGPATVISVEDSMRKCNSLAGVQDYLMRLGNDLVIRLDEDNLENNRVATRLTLKYRTLKDQFRSVGTGMPRSVTNTIASPENRAIIVAKSALTLFKRLGDAVKDGAFHLTGIGVSAGVFKEQSVGQRDLREMMLSGGNRKRKAEAEEGVPPKETETTLPGVQCSQCGIYIPQGEVQTHKDFHFAQQISLSDRKQLPGRQAFLLTPTERLAKRARKVKAKTLMSFVKVLSSKDKK